MMQKIVPKIKSLGLVFFLTVLAPTTLAILYFGLIASDVYISESSFVVRSPEKKQLGGLGALVSGSSILPAGNEDLYTVRDYAISRDAAGALNRGGRLYNAYTRPQIDVINRFNVLNTQDTKEDLFQYYKDHVTVDYDTRSSVATLKVRAYTAEDAYRINSHLLQLSEGLVNRLNLRGQQDLIRYAENTVGEAEAQAAAAALALSAYRDRKSVVDPEKQASVQLQLISKLQDELIASRTQLDQLRAFAPSNPQIPVLQSRNAALAGEIADETAKIAGGNRSLAGVAGPYQRLVLKSQFADHQLTSAMTSLDQAREEARRKQIYIERIVQPNMPDAAIEPRRLRGIFATFAIGLILWGVASMLVAGVKEHQA